MEATGGEPDVIQVDCGFFVLCDCCAQSPTGRRNLCFDSAAQKQRQAPKGYLLRAMCWTWATSMGVSLLDAAQYAALRAVVKVDTATSSWVATPADVRALGGALFCDFRCGYVFTYHNGAASFYSSSGFRGMIKV